MPQFNGQDLNGYATSPSYWNGAATRTPSSEMSPRIIDPNTNRPFDRFDQWGITNPGGPESPYALPHVVQFSTILTTGWKVYISRRYDNAYKTSQREAVDMANNDCFVMGIVNERRHATAGLNWRIEIDDEQDGVEKALKDSFTKIVKHFPFWNQFSYYMMLDIWYGRMASQVVWKWKDMALPDPKEAMPTMSIPGLPPSSPSKTPKHWRKVAVVDQHQPVNGDSIIHHFDGTPGVLLHMPTEVQGGEKVWGDKGAALLLRGSWRDRFLMKMHEPWAGDFFDADSAEAIHGLGIRHFIYWMNFMRQEWLANVADWCERTGLGVRLWYYQGGNKKSEDAVRTAARTQSDRTNILIPRYGDGNRAVEGVEYVDTASTGAELLLKLWKHLEDIIERYIIGQKMSGGTDDSGIGGSGVSDFAQNTKQQIIKHDANNFADFFTKEYVQRVLGWSFPIYRSVPIRFRFNVDQPSPQNYFQAVSAFIGLGGTVKEDEARAVLGASEPQEGDKILKRQEPPAVGGGPGTGGNDLMNLLAPPDAKVAEDGKDLDLDSEGGDISEGPPTAQMGEEDENVSQKVKTGEVLQYGGGNPSHAQGPVAGTNVTRAGEFTSANQLGTPTAETAAGAVAGGQKPFDQQQKAMTGQGTQQAVPGSNGGKGQGGAGAAGQQQAPMVGFANDHMLIQQHAQKGFKQATTVEAKQKVYDHWMGVHKNKVMDSYSGMKSDLGGNVPDQFKNTLQEAHKSFGLAMKMMKNGAAVDLVAEMQPHNMKIDAEMRHLLSAGHLGGIQEAELKEAQGQQAGHEALVKNLEAAKKEDPNAPASTVKKFLPEGSQPAHSFEHAIGQAKEGAKAAEEKINESQGEYDIESLAGERDKASERLKKAQDAHSELSNKGVNDLRMTMAENELKNAQHGHTKAGLRHAAASRPSDFAWRGEDWHKENVGDLPRKTGSPPNAGSKPEHAISQAKEGASAAGEKVGESQDKVNESAGSKLGELSKHLTKEGITDLDYHLAKGKSAEDFIKSNDFFDEEGQKAIKDYAARKSALRKDFETRNEERYSQEKSKRHAGFNENWQFKPKSLEDLHEASRDLDYHEIEQHVKDMAQGKTKAELTKMMQEAGHIDIPATKDKMIAQMARMPSQARENWLRSQFGKGVQQKNFENRPEHTASPRPGQTPADHVKQLREAAKGKQKE